MAKTAKEWIKTPPFPTSHFVDSRIYTDETLFKEEQEKIFNKSWILQMQTMRTLLMLLAIMVLA